ncbi:MAG: WD40 repeat domain-containing protein [Proteobacteria bacterium]|nr:WD40 repeat domain-containing protein [Pseudomonadota bacterium]
MASLPHRFVPTTSKFVSPVRLVSQFGHGAAINLVAFSPCEKYFASSDVNGWLRIWSLETLDILGIFLLEFRCESITWEESSVIVCHGQGQERRIEFLEGDAQETVETQPAFRGGVIRLLDSPEVTEGPDFIEIHYSDYIFKHDVPGIISQSMDPCERYVAVHCPDIIRIFSCYEDEELVTLAPESGKTWINMWINKRGDAVICLQSNGAICLVNAVKKEIKWVKKGDTVVVKASSFSGEHYLIYGDERGNLTVFDVVSRSILLRTPRCPIEFSAVFPTADKVGFVGLRTESATAFFAHSKEILSASPLPASLSVACSGTAFSEIIAACTDNCVYRLCLADNSISKVCKTSVAVDAIGSTKDVVFVHLEDGSAGVCEFNNLAMLKWKCEETPLSLAVSDNGKTLAALFPDRVVILDRAEKKGAQTYKLSGGVQIACGREKSANQLLVFMNDLRVISLDMRTGEQTELNKLAIEHGRVLSTAPAAKSMMYVLLAGEHGQFIALKLGMNTGKSSVVLRVLSMGTQIWGAAVAEDSVCLRNDATCLRIISGMKAFSIDDWARSEPLQIF